MTIKVDLAKAYDMIPWDFFYDILVEARISDAMINIIMHCVTFCSMKVLWNDEKTEGSTKQLGLPMEARVCQNSSLQIERDFFFLF